MYLCKFGQNPFADSDDNAMKPILGQGHQTLMLPPHFPSNASTQVW